ncbi:MAG: FGGY-family carbohydrate kinase [Alphaproteobacteria bacterium]|nr:FGGY-family carbohydrate kinase [Alphaproteobacteria bacterium]
MTRKKIKHIAVIDIGKTNAKLVLFDAMTQTQIDVKSCSNKIVKQAPYPHYDIDRLWEFIMLGLYELNIRHGIDGISITTHGATAALVSGDRLALPILDYEFDGVEDCFAAYDKLRPEFSETLSPKLPIGLNLGAQIYWQSQRFEDEFSGVTDILMYPQYWAWRLTGIKASEVTSLGTHTDLWSPDAGDYSSLVTALGWRELFPPMRKASDILGCVKAEIAEGIGLDADTPVVCGIHDSNASLLPYLGAVKPSFSVISSGTWTIHMTVGGSTSGLDAARDSLANVDAYGRAVPTARFMGGREYEVLMGDENPEIGVADLDFIVGQDVFILPSFAAGVGCFPNSTGKWVGDENALNMRQRGAAVALYLAMMSAECLTLAECGETLIVEGPLAKNTCYLSVLSALTGKPVHGSQDATGTSIGASMLFETETAPLVLSDAVKPYGNSELGEYAKKWLSLVG